MNQNKQPPEPKEVEEPTSCDPKNTTKVQLVRPSANTPIPEIARGRCWLTTRSILQTKFDEQRSNLSKVAMRVVSQLLGTNKRFSLSATRLAACSWAFWLLP